MFEDCCLYVWCVQVFGFKYGFELWVFYGCGVGQCFVGVNIGWDWFDVCGNIIIDDGD